jgi:sugar phosphate permease
MRNAEGKIYYGWFVALAGFLCTFISVGLAIYSFSLFIVPMSAALTAPRTSVALAASLFTVSMGVVSIFVGGQVARGRVRHLVAAGIVLTGGGYAVLSVADSLPLFYFCYVLIGVGCACTGPVLTSSLMTAWFDRRRGLAVGITSCGASVCAMVLPSVLAAVMASGGVRAAYLACSFLTVLTLVLVVAIVRPSPTDLGLLPDGLTPEEYEARPETSRPEPTGLTPREALKTSAMWALCVAFAMLGFAQMGVMQNAAPFLHDLSFDAETAATALRYIGVAGAVSTILSGWVADHNPRVAFCLGNATLAVGALFLAYTRADSGYAWVLSYALFFGLGMGVWASALPLITGNVLGVKHFGAIWGIVFAAKSLGGDSLGVPAVSAVAGVTGYVPGFWLAIAFLVVSAALVVLTKRPQDRRAEEPTPDFRVSLRDEARRN